MNQKKKKNGLLHSGKKKKKNGSAGTAASSRQQQPVQKPQRRPVLFDQDTPAGQNPEHRQSRMQEIYWTPKREQQEGAEPVRPQDSRTEKVPKNPSEKRSKQPGGMSKASQKDRTAGKPVSKTARPERKKAVKGSDKPAKKAGKKKARTSLEDIKRNANQSARKADRGETLREEKKKEAGLRSLRRRRGMSAFYYVMMVLFVLGVGITLCLTVFFRIETVGVEGKGRYSTQQIRDAAAIEAGDSLLMVDAEKAAQRVESLLPYAENVKVEKRMPSIVTISYEEASEAIAVSDGERLVILSAQYKVLRFADELPQGTVLAKGIRIGECSEGAAAVFTDEQEEKLLKEAADCLRETGFTGLTEFDFSEPGNLRARFEDRITIVFGTQQDLTAKLRLAQGVLSEKIGPNEKGTLTVSAVPRANFLPDYSTDESSSGPEEDENSPEQSGEPEEEDKESSAPESAA
ncbi:MAG: FtsQ-type POTRA domain-containing protein [Clostridiales bacterium]|nr:FtsQ-type POTRA domain-containing protein [Clostridiales bacterium]